MKVIVLRTPGIHLGFPGVEGEEIDVPMETAQKMLNAGLIGEIPDPELTTKPRESSQVEVQKQSKKGDK